LIDGGFAVVFNNLVIAGGIGVEISSLKWLSVELW